MGLNSYFDLIPEEMKAKIVFYLSSYEILQFFRAYPDIRNTLCITLFRNINFYNELRLTEQDIYEIAHAKEPYRITTLNINGIHWISSTDLMECIKNFFCLKYLYAINTQIGVSPSECLAYRNLTKLETIAVTVNESHFTEESILYFPPVRYVYFHIYSYLNLHQLIEKLVDYNTTIEKLLVCDDGTPYSEFTLNYYHNELNKLQEGVLCLPSEGTLFFRDSDLWKTILDELFGYNFKPWYFIPFGINDIKGIRKNNHKFEKVFIEELSYKHEMYKPYNHELRMKLMKYPNLRYLNKLLLNFCIFQNFESPNETESKVFKNVLKNSSLIHELELWMCDVFDCNAIIPRSALDNIPRWIHLRKLSLFNIPREIRGENLSNVFKKCDKIEFLQIKSPGSKKFLKNLCLALSHLKSLKDFRYEDHILPSINVILKAFTQNKCENLMKMCIKCEISYKFTISVLKKFLLRYPNVICLVFITENMTTEKQRDMQELLNRYMDNKHKAYFVARFDFELSNFLPVIYRKDLVDSGSRICVFKYLENDIFK